MRAFMAQVSSTMTKTCSNSLEFKALVQTSCCRPKSNVVSVKVAKNAESREPTSSLGKNLPQRKWTTSCSWMQEKTQSKLSTTQLSLVQLETHQLNGMKVTLATLVKTNSGTWTLKNQPKKANKALMKTLRSSKSRSLYNLMAMSLSWP